MIDKNKHIPELYDALHKHDTNKISFDYEKKLLEKSLSPIMFKNENNRNFLYKLQQMMVFNIDSILELRNFFNHTVDKYYEKHSN